MHSNVGDGGDGHSNAEDDTVLADDEKEYFSIVSLHLNAADPSFCGNINDAGMKGS